MMNSKEVRKKMDEFNDRFVTKEKKMSTIYPKDNKVLFYYNNYGNGSYRLTGEEMIEVLKFRKSVTESRSPEKTGIIEGYDRLISGYNGIYHGEWWKDKTLNHGTGSYLIATRKERIIAFEQNKRV